jgi:hypothetical protein
VAYGAASEVYYDMTPDGGSFVHRNQGSLQLYSVTTGTLVDIYPPAPTANVDFAAVRVSPLGNKLAYVRYPQYPPVVLTLVVAAWDRSTNVIGPEVIMGDGEGWTSDFSPQGDRLLTVTSNQMRICKVADGTIENGISSIDLGGLGAGFSWSPGGDKIAFRRSSEPAKIYVIPTSNLWATPVEIDLGHILPASFTIQTLDWSK